MATAEESAPAAVTILERVRVSVGDRDERNDRTVHLPANGRYVRRRSAITFIKCAFVRIIRLEIHDTQQRRAIPSGDAAMFDVAGVLHDADGLPSERESLQQQRRFTVTVIHRRTAHDDDRESLGGNRTMNVNTKAQIGTSIDVFGRSDGCCAVVRRHLRTSRTGPENHQRRSSAERHTRYESRSHAGSDASAARASSRWRTYSANFSRSAATTSGLAFATNFSFASFFSSRSTSVVKRAMSRP